MASTNSSTSNSTSSSSSSSSSGSAGRRGNFLSRIRFHLGNFSLLVTMVHGRHDEIRNKEDELLKQHNGFGPISKTRDKNKIRVIVAEVFSVIVCCVLLLLYRWFTQETVFAYCDVCTVVGMLISFILSGFIRRCCLFCEEYTHVDQRYMGSLKDAFKACISLENGKTEIGLVFFGCAAFIIHALCNGQSFLFPIGLYVITSLCISLCINTAGWHRLTDVEISDMNESGMKNISAGLAWSFYFGYLKIILPGFANIFQQPNDDKDGNNQIDGIDINDKITDKRLFIVIPKDGCCYKEFVDIDDRIKFIRSMPAQKKARGGVQERSYKNSLYQINIDGEEPIYVVMEYATPLLSMYDMSKASKADFTEADRNTQVTEFYKKLNTILDGDPECKGRSKLILMGPGAQCDLKGENRLADIIWKNHAK